MKILIDIGSSTIKAYKYSGGKLIYWLVRTINFKDGYSELTGISDVNKLELIEFLEEVKKKYPKAEIKTFATAIFRKLTVNASTQLIDEIFMRTGILLNIISQDLESFYLQTALTGKYDSAEPVLLINIGGGSTELVVTVGKEAIERFNIDLGVGKILSEFDGINNHFSAVAIEKVEEFVLDFLPAIKNNVKTAFYTGGELTYMKLASYKLKNNFLFKDLNHPSIISFSNFQKRNLEIYNLVGLPELEALMPHNPKWMMGARACSTIAQAICKKYKIENIIPSDVNLIDGVIGQEFRRVTISGSFRKHLEQISKVKKSLVKNGIEILSPRFEDPKDAKSEFVVFKGEEGLLPLQLERYHLDSISRSDALIVCDPQGYVGASALIEIGYATSLGKRIIFTEKPEEFMLNTLPSEVGL